MCTRTGTNYTGDYNLLRLRYRKLVQSVHSATVHLSFNLDPSSLEGPTTPTGGGNAKGIPPPH